jgi:imidazolonepropionase-like amidohydrolase
MGNHGAIRSATMTNAEILRQDTELGQLKAGFKADLIVVDGNPLDDIGVLENDGAHIRMVMRDGMIFKDELVAS